MISQLKDNPLAKLLTNQSINSTEKFTVIKALAKTKIDEALGTETNKWGHKVWRVVLKDLKVDITYRPDDAPIWAKDGHIEIVIYGKK